MATAAQHREDWEFQWSLVLFFTGLFGYPAMQLLWYSASAKLFPKQFTSLSLYNRLDWSQRGPTAVHALVLTLAAFKVVFLKDWSTRCLVTGRDAWVPLSAGLELGYIVQDTCAEVAKKVFCGRWFSWAHWAHHLIILAVLPQYFLTANVKGDLLFAYFFLMNSSTVLLQLRYYTLKLGLQRTLLHKAVMALLPLSFFLCRVCILPHLLAVYGARVGLPWYQVPFHLKPICNVVAFGFTALNCYWFCLMLQTGLRQRKPAAKLS